MTVEELVKAAKAEIVEVDVAAARALAGEGVLFVDVREPGECAQGMIEGALAIPRGVLEFKLAQEPRLADRTQPIVVYCQSGGRSALAAQTLQRLGFGAVKSLAGGYSAWSSAG